MKARRVMLILGSIICLLLVALVAWSVWAHDKEEKEKNRKQTAPAREARQANRNKTPDSGDGVASQEVTPDPTPSEPEKVEVNASVS